MAATLNPLISAGAYLVTRVEVDSLEHSLDRLPSMFGTCPPALILPHRTPTVHGRTSPRGEEGAPPEPVLADGEHALDEALRGAGDLHARRAPPLG